MNTILEAVGYAEYSNVSELKSLTSNRIINLIQRRDDTNHATRLF